MLFILTRLPNIGNVFFISSTVMGFCCIPLIFYYHSSLYSRCQLPEIEEEPKKFVCHVWLVTCNVAGGVNCYTIIILCRWNEGMPKLTVSNKKNCWFPDSVSKVMSPCWNSGRTSSDKFTSVDVTQNCVTETDSDSGGLWLWKGKRRL